MQNSIFCLSTLQGTAGKFLSPTQILMCHHLVRFWKMAQAENFSAPLVICPLLCELHININIWVKISMYLKVNKLKTCKIKEYFSHERRLSKKMANCKVCKWYSYIREWYTRYIVISLRQFVELDGECLSDFYQS